MTDPAFAKRLNDLLKHEKTLSFKSIALIKIGRHFRIHGQKVIVGRNERENQRLYTIAQRENRPYIEVSNYMGPITLLESNPSTLMITIAAGLTVRYSDAPRNVDVEITYKGPEQRIYHARALDLDLVEQMLLK